MGRRISSSRSRGFSSGGFKASSFRSSSRSTGFRPSASRNIGGYRYRYRPYRRNYFFHSLGPTGKIIYIILVIVFFIIITFMGY